MLIVTNTDTHTRTFRILVLNSLTNTQLLTFRVVKALIETNIHTHIYIITENSLRSGD